MPYAAKVLPWQLQLDLSQLAHCDSDLDKCTPCLSASAFASCFPPGRLSTLSPRLSAPLTTVQQQQQQQHQAQQEQQQQYQKYAAYIATCAASASGRMSSYRAPGTVHSSHSLGYTIHKQGHPTSPPFLTTFSSSSSSPSSSFPPSSLSTISAAATSALPRMSQSLLRALKVGGRAHAGAFAGPPSILHHHNTAPPNQYIHMAPRTHYAAPHLASAAPLIRGNERVMTINSSSGSSSAPAAANMTCRAVRGMTITGPLAENNSTRSSRGEDKSEQEQEEGQEEEWRAKEFYESNHRHSNYLNRKRRAPRTDLSKLTAGEQTRWKRAKARQYSASARRRHAEKDEKLRDTVETLSIYRVLIKAAPDAVLLLSPGVQARILFANVRCSKLLRLPWWGGEKQSLVGRCLWEWMDAADKATVVAAIATGTSCSDTQHLVRCTLRSPSSPAQQKQQQQEAAGGEQGRWCLGHADECQASTRAKTRSCSLASTASLISFRSQHMRKQRR